MHTACIIYSISPLSFASVCAVAARGRGTGKLERLRGGKAKLASLGDALVPKGEKERVVQVVAFAEGADGERGESAEGAPPCELLL